MKKREKMREYYILSILFIFINTFLFSQSLNESENYWGNIDNIDEKEYIKIENAPYKGACFINYGFSLLIGEGIGQLYQKFEGRFNDESKEGSYIHLRDDLGLDRYVSSGLIFAYMSINSFREYFEYTYYKFDGNREIARDITIDGITFTQGTKVFSTAKIERWRFITTYNIFANEYLAVGPSLKVDVIRWYYDFKAIDSNTGEIKRADDDNVIPLINPGFQVDFSFIDSFIMTFSLYALPYKQDGVSLKQVYVSLMGRYYFINSVFIYSQGGYEYIKIESDRDDDIDAEMIFHSWNVALGVGISF